MHNRSLSRELSLISLGLIKDKGDFKLNKFQIEEIFESALDSLINHCRDELDNCESELENDSQKILDSELKEKLLSVFIPTAPNPTTGWYTLVPESSVKDLDISVEDAFRTIISAGIVNPDEKNNTTNPTFSKLFSQLRASTNTSS